MKRLSIITIAFNDCNGLKLTIESVFRQTAFDEIEYIVIDGGSKDGSKELLESYSDKFTYWVSEPDTGIYNAMNKGAFKATGEYMLFLNSGDNLANPSVIEVVLPQLTGEDVICGNIITYTNNDDALLCCPPQNIGLFTFYGGSLPHPSAFIKRSLFERLGGYKECYRIISDWCFFVDALLVDNCSYKTISTIITHFNRFGISSTQGEKEAPMQKTYLRERFGRIVDDQIPVKDEALANCMYYVANCSGIWGAMLRFPIKVYNRVLKLRTRISRRIAAVPIKNWR